MAEPTAQPHNPDRYRSDIEGLRAIAVLSVVLYHAGIYGTPGGFIGVDVFFTLSGYLITGLLDEELRNENRIDLVGFYARRGRRLLPAAMVMLVAVLVVAVMLMAPSRVIQTARGGIAASFYASNVWFQSLNDDYFAAGSAYHPLLHTWSLAVEEQFYLVWPLLLFALARIAKSRKAILGSLAFITVVVFALSYHRTTSNPSWAFFASVSRAWEFSIGGIAALLTVARWPAVSRRTAAIGAALALAALLASVALITPMTRFPGWVAGVPVVSTALLLLFGGLPGLRDLPTYRALSIAPLRFLGRLSYSWYLWHWPVLVYVRWLTDDFSLVVRFICLIIALGIAYLSYRLVENPIRFNRKLIARPALTVVLALMASATSAGLAYGALRVAERDQLLPSQRVFTRATRDRARIYALRCVQSTGVAKVLECTFGDTTSDTTMVLIGDSHAAQWFPAIENEAETRHWRLVTMIKVSCAVADVRSFNIAARGVEPQCQGWRQAAFARIAALKPKRVVVAETEDYVSPLVNEEHRQPVPIAEWTSGLSRSLNAIASASEETVVLRDTPRMRRSVPECLAQESMHPSHRYPSCDTPRAEAISEEVHAANLAAVASVPRARFVDVTDQFCDQSVCAAARNNHIHYFDSDHITASYATLVADTLVARMDRAVEAGPSLRSGRKP